MAHWHTLYIPLLLVAAALTTALALYAGRRLAASGAAMFMLLMLAVAVWCWGYGFQLGSVARSAKLFWTQVQYIGVVAVPGTWLAFVLQYTGQGRCFGKLVFNFTSGFNGNYNVVNHNQHSY